MVKTIDKYRYRIKNTGFSSKRFGNCEVCGKHVSEVYFQVEQRTVLMNDGTPFWSRSGDWFGHKECLESKQK